MNDVTQAGAEAAPAETVLSLDDAVARLDALPDETFTPAGDAPSEPDPKPSDEGEGSEAPQASSEAEGEPGDEPETESEGDAIEGFAHGNLKVRLRDGTETTVAQLKKASGDHVREIERLKAEAARITQESQARQAQPAPMHAQAKAVLDHALQIVQAQLGNPPPESLRNEDPVEYLVQVEAYNRKRAQYIHMAQMRNAEEQRAAAEKQRQQQAMIQKHQAEIYKVMPELKDPQKATAFYNEAAPVLRDYGLSDEEIGATTDPRFWRTARDLIEYRKLKARVEKAEKVAADKTKLAAPVVTAPPAAPGKRATTQERKVRDDRALRERFHKTGSVDDAVARLDALGI